MDNFGLWIICKVGFFQMNFGLCTHFNELSQTYPNEFPDGSQKKAWPKGYFAAFWCAACGNLARAWLAIAYLAAVSFLDPEGQNIVYVLPYYYSTIT